MRILERLTLYRDGEYVAFPNLAWLPGGRLACFFRHARDRRREGGEITHIDPTARDVFILASALPPASPSVTFSPELHLVLDDDMSEQDPCVTVLRRGPRAGRILVTCFRWRLVEPGRGPGTWGAELFARYGRSREAGPGGPGAYDAFNIGFHVNLSDDGGATWRALPVIEPRGYVPGSAVRGNILELPDGRLLLPFYGCRRVGDLAAAGVMVSTDQGETWEFLAEAARDPAKNFLEPNLYRTPSGRIWALCRTQSDFRKPGVEFEDTYLPLHGAVSEDEGRSFGPVREFPGVFGSNPFHVLPLADGRALVTYGYRREPYGIRCRLCDGELAGLEAAPEVVLRDDAPSGDLGYTHAAELPDGSVLVVYYIAGDDGVRVIEGTRLRVCPPGA